MAEHRIEPSSGDDGILDLAPEEAPSPHPALTRPPADPKLAAAAAQPLPCPGCGYDLRGLRGGACPECGKRLTYSTIRTAEQRRAGRTQSTWFDRTAAIWGGVGVLVAGAVYGLTHEPASAALLALAVFLVATIAVGWVVFFACSMMWIGFDQPLPKTVVQLAGAYGGYVGIVTLLGAAPIPGFLIWLFSSMCLVGLLAKLLDIDWRDASIVAILSAGLGQPAAWALFSLLPA